VDPPVRSWNLVDKTFVATATVRVGGATPEDGADARFTVEQGDLVTVSVQVCGPSAACPTTGGTSTPGPRPSPIGNASEPSGLNVAAHLTADARAFTQVGGGFAGGQTVGPFDTATWTWTLRADRRGNHVLAVQVTARRVSDGAPVGDGETVEMAVRTGASIGEFLTRRALAIGPAVGGLAAVALITLGVVVVIRRRRMRER
jgi:hypothetical protein